MSGKASNRKDMTEPMFEPSDVIEAIEEARGSVTDAAEILGVKRQTIYNYMDKHPEIGEALTASRTQYTTTCQELARDNHLTQLFAGHAAATAYELAKLEPKPDSVNIDPAKLTVEELVELRRILAKGKPDGSDPA
jgi:transposase-like protein